MSDIIELTFISPHAILDEGAIVGKHLSLYPFSHIQEGAIVGEFVTIGEQCFIEKGAVIEDCATIKNGVSVWNGISIGAGAFIGPGVVFTNDRTPRSARWIAEPRDWLLPTSVEEGASLGAGSIILPGLTIGKYAMVGAGSVVTRTVQPFALVSGVPARLKGWVNERGEIIRADESGN